MSKLRVDKIAAPIVEDKFTGSVFFDGTGDNLTIPASTDFAWGTGDFTWEAWVYSTASDHTTGNHYMFDLGGGNLGAMSYYENKFNYYNTTVGGTRQIGGFAAFEWHHVAVARQSGTTYMFLDGVMESSFADTHNYGTSALAVEIAGYAGGSTLNWQGYISNLRVCKGHAVYTGNFTVPTRELEVHKAPPKGVVFPAVDNVTVLLACQSSTDATADSSGRHTITAGGNATAADANPGLLSNTNITSTITENTGSVAFDGNGDYLSVGDPGNDFDLAGDFTVEFWVYFNSAGMYQDIIGTATNSVYLGSGKGGWVAAYYVSMGASKWHFSYQTNSSWTFENHYSFSASTNTWYHVAFTREGSDLKCYVDGLQRGSAISTSTNLISTEKRLSIGAGHGASSGFLNGYVSNVRVCKGHAVYTSNFVPPTRELEVHQGPDDDRTVLLACYDGENVFAEKTGKIVAAYGDRLSSPTPTATDSPIGITTNYPPVTRNVDPTAGPTFQGGAGYTSQNWLTLPKGTTAERMPNFATNAVTSGGTRAIYHSGESPTTSTYDTIEYLNIATLGDIADFGNLTNQKLNQVACSSDTRGLFATGYTPSPAGGNNYIDYVTIMSTGNAKDFGDLSFVTYVPDACSNQIRGIFAGGAAAPNYSGQTNIDYVTISTLGNGKDFGDLTRARHSLSGLASPTRGVFAAGNASPVSNLNNIDYITIASTGNAQDFGDLPVGRAGCAGASSAIRGLFGGGYTATPAVKNIIDFITISSMGNALDFGDLTAVRRFGGATSSTTRGVFVAGFDPAATNVIDYVSIQTTGNAVDFGDTINKTQSSACSNGHGGLG